jgi:protein transport protein SEC61 subunit gamma-like protein
MEEKPEQNLGQSEEGQNSQAFQDVQDVQSQNSQAEAQSEEHVSPSQSSESTHHYTQPQAQAQVKEPSEKDQKEERKLPSLKINLPKIGAASFFSKVKSKISASNIKAKFQEYGRVLKVAKKPDKEEFKTIVKASGLGMLLIGFVGFIIAIVIQLTKLR